jgi:hypothetical protein
MPNPSVVTASKVNRKTLRETLQRPCINTSCHDFRFDDNYPTAHAPARYPGLGARLQSFFITLYRQKPDEMNPKPPIFAEDIQAGLVHRPGGPDQAINEQMVGRWPLPEPNLATMLRAAINPRYLTPAG